MGEVLRHVLTVRVAPGFELDVAQLPQAGSALNDDLEVREVDWSKNSNSDGAVYQLVLTYQVFKGVRNAEVVEVPSSKLRFLNGDESIEAEVPAWNFTLTPILPPDLADEQVKLADPLPPPPLSTRPYSSVLLWLGIALLGWLVVAAWHWELPPFRRTETPFARARKGVRNLRRQPPTLENIRKAWKLVHAALDASAGHTLFQSQLAGWLDDHPQLEHARGELEAFFARSNQLFFAPDPTELPLPKDFSLDRLENLCRVLHRCSAHIVPRKTAAQSWLSALPATFKPTLTNEGGGKK